MGLSDISGMLANYQNQKRLKEERDRANAEAHTIQLGNVLPYLAQSLVQGNPTAGVLGGVGELARAMSGSDKDVAGGMQSMTELMPTDWGKATPGENPIVSKMRDWNIKRTRTPREEAGLARIEKLRKDPKYQETSSIDPYTGEERIGFSDKSLEQERLNIAKQELEIARRKAAEKDKGEVIDPLTKSQMRNFYQYKTFKEWMDDISRPVKQPGQSLVASGKLVNNETPFYEIMQQAGVDMNRLRYEAAKHFATLNMGYMPTSKAFMYDTEQTGSDGMGQFTR